MASKDSNVLLNERELQIVAAISNLVKVTDEAIEEYGMLHPDQIPTEIHDKINAVHDDFIALMGFDASDPMADVKVLIETIDLFHRAVPSYLVERTWALLLGPTALLNAMQGGMNPITVAESMHRLISQLKIDQDGWVEGLKDEA